jgi:hypothetical protein
MKENRDAILEADENAEIFVFYTHLLKTPFWTTKK